MNHFRTAQYIPRLDVLDWVRKYAETQHAQAMANAAASQVNTSLSVNADGSPSKGYDGLKIAGLNGTGAPTASKVSVEIIDMDEREQMRRRKEKEEEDAMKRLVPTRHRRAGLNLLGIVDNKMLYLPGIRTALYPGKPLHSVFRMMLMQRFLLRLNVPNFLDLPPQRFLLCRP